MKNFVILLFLIPMVINANAQDQQYFNNIYNPENTYSSGRGILQIDNNYYGIFGTLESSGYWYNLGVFKMSSTGDLVNLNLIGVDGYDYFAGSVGGTLVQTNDGNLAFACHVGNTGPTIGTLVKLNLDLDTIWKRVYHIEDQNTMTIKAKQTTDGGYIIVGQVYPGTGYYFDALIVKTNNLGSESWYSTFGVNSNASEYGTDIIETPDGGYLIGGIKDIEAIDHSLDAMLIKTDSLGSEEWTHYYGNPDVDDDMTLVALTDDGNYLVATVYGDEIFAPTARSGRIFLLKIDNNGNTILEKKIGPKRINVWIKNLRKTSNGYILSGFSYETDSSTFQYNSGWMMKLNNNLDSVWYRDYIFGDETWDNLFYDAYPTTDNGYIAIGKARPDMGGENNMWIVKVDSMGCDTPGCFTTAIPELSPSLRGQGEELRIWPNPTTEQFEVWSSKFEVGGDKMIWVYNSQGLKVEEIKVPDGTETLSVNVSSYPNGLYFLQLIISNKVIGSTKIIKK